MPSLIPRVPATAPGTGAGLRPAVGPRGPAAEPVGEDEALREVREAAGGEVPAPVRRVRLGVRVAGLFDLGSTPGPTGGLALAGAVFGRRWRVELSGLWLAPRTAGRVDPAVDLRARVGLLAAGLRGCGVPGWRALEFPLCGGFEAGALRGTGLGTALGVQRSDALPWLAITAGPGLVWSPVARVGLGLAIDVVVPVLRRGFAVGGFEQPVYTSGEVAGRVSVGLELRFR